MQYLKDKISVIIPVYNIEKYLEKCLESVINQTYENLEIICVYDPSSDKSYDILEKFSKIDDRIVVIKRNEKSGLSVARNVGLKAASGEFVYFLDGDDWISSDFLQLMHEAIVKYKQEAVCCTNVLHVFEDGTTGHFLKREADGFVKFSQSCIMAWGWLLRRSYLDRFTVLFPAGLRYEDTWFFYVVIRPLENVYILNTPVYYHNENPDSLMGKAKGRIIKDYDSITVVDMVYEYYKANDRLKTWSVPFFYLPKYCLNRHLHKEEYFLRLKDFYAKIEKDIISNNNLYSSLEIKFLREIIDNGTYETFSGLNTSIIGALRKNVMEQNGKSGRKI